jgi:electron transfer flavoprotein alpha subunit
MAGVLVIGEVAGGALSAASLEVLTAAASLASGLGEPLAAAVIGGDVAAAAAAMSGAAPKVYAAGGAHFAAYTADAYIAAAEALIEAASPSVVLFTHTLQTREWVPRLAAKLDAGLVLDCVSLTAEGSDVVIQKPVYGGGVVGTFVVRSALRLATVRTGVFEPAQGGGSGEVVSLDIPAPAAGAVMLIEQVAAGESTGPKLKDAKVVVSGGRGVGGPDNWHYIEACASAIGGAVGCSRPVADSGWVPSSHQVGLSGTSVTPDLYIAVGISGAVQHLAGISGAKTVVAINMDGEADIFGRANYGVVGDYQEVLPAFVNRVKQLRP